MRSQISCKLAGCESKPIKRGLCMLHWRMENPDHLKCNWPGCERKRAAPVTAGLCEGHNPAYGNLTTLEARALAAMAEGKSEVEALQLAGLSAPQAVREVRAQRKRPAYFEAMQKLRRKAGIRPEAAMQAIGRAMEAQKTRTYVNDDGVKVKELCPDVKLQLEGAKLYQTIMHGMAPKRSEVEQEIRQGIVFLSEKAELPPEIRAIVIDDDKDDE